MKLFSLLLVLFLALAGCREAIVGPEPTLPQDPNDPSAPAPTDAPQIYLKVPQSMPEGETRNLRGGPVHPIETAMYFWQWWSPDGAAIEFTSSADSYPNTIDAIAIRSGTVHVTVTARDAQTDSVRGIGRATVPICPRGMSECSADERD